MTAEPEEATPKQHPSVEAGIKGRAFWLLCVMEMWERFAYYGVRVVMPIYIAQADEPGGLHFSQEDKGTIYAWWSIFQSVLPTFTGGLADRYGYKRTLAFSVTLKVVGYMLMASQRSFGGFFVGVLFLATGTALFKPGIQGSLAHTLKKGNTSVGWGIFYWLVNVGAMLGPFLAAALRQIGWEELFWVCSGIVSLNYLMLFTYPTIESGADKSEGFAEVVVRTFKDFLNPRLLMFLTLMAGFWLMMYQLWDLHPNFIVDWVDSSAMVGAVPAWMTHETERGQQVLQEHLLNINATLIVLIIVPISALVRKIKTLRAMLGGMIVATLGVLVAGLTQSGWVLALGVVLFSLGEMLTGPKKNEYLGLIAPPGKKALYLGYVNIPVGIGTFIGAKLAGWLYGSYGEKATLALKYLCQHTDYLATHDRPAWNGEVDTLERTVGVDRSEAMNTLVEVVGESHQAVTDTLWTTYQPYQVWYVFAAIGIASTIGLVFFNRAASKWKDMDY